MSTKPTISQLAKNPFISERAPDTLDRVSGALDFVQQIVIAQEQGHIELTPNTTTGYFFLLESLRKAVEFESCRMTDKSKTQEDLA